MKMECLKLFEVDILKGLGSEKSNGFHNKTQAIVLKNFWIVAKYVAFKVLLFIGANI